MAYFSQNQIHLCALSEVSESVSEVAVPIARDPDGFITDQFQYHVPSQWVSVRLVNEVAPIARDPDGVLRDLISIPRAL